jgi:hypothetical protein
MAEDTNTGAVGATPPAGNPPAADSTPTRLTIPAATALGLDEAPGETLARMSRGDEPATPPAAPAEPAAATPPATPPVTPPAEPAAATPPATATPPAAPAAPAKIKVGNKEYTQEELEKALNQPATPPAASAAPAAQTPPAAPAKPEPTPEEIAQAQSNWVSEFIKDEKLSIGIAENEMEVLLSGGKDAVALFTNKMNEAVGRAVLLARKSIYTDVNPKMAEIEQLLQPLVHQNVQLEYIATKQAFLAKHTDFAPHVSTADSVAKAIVEQFPEQVRKMTREQFIDEVAAQTDRILQRNYKEWNPSATDTWRDHAKRVAAGSAPATPATPPATPAAQAQPGATPPATPAAPKIQPPSANSPAGIPAGGATPNWHKDVAKSLAAS